MITVESDSLKKLPSAAERECFTMATSNKSKVTQELKSNCTFFFQIITFTTWVQMNHIPDELVEILRKERLSTIEDLKNLTEEDVRELGLPLGYKKRLKKALNML